MRSLRREPYILVHQTGLSNTAVAKDDDLVSVSALPSSSLRFELPTFNKIFLREAILVLFV